MSMNQIRKRLKALEVGSKQERLPLVVFVNPPNVIENYPDGTQRTHSATGYEPPKGFHGVIFDGQNDLED